MIKIKDSKNLKALILKNGYDISSFARLVSMSNQSITKLTLNTMNPSPKSAYKIKEALHVDWDDLFIIPEVK